MYSPLLHLINCTDSRELLCAASKGLVQAASALPDDPQINATWVINQVKLHPDIVIISCAESSPLANGTINALTTLSHPSGQAIEFESYVPLSELVLLVEVTSLPGLHMKLLPLPVDWPRRPAGGFENDSQGFSDESVAVEVPPAAEKV